MNPETNVLQDLLRRARARRQLLLSLRGVAISVGVVAAVLMNVLILKTLSWGPMNGYAIAQWVRQATLGDIELEEGALYPALHRMEHRAWVTAEWGVSENNRRAKYYRLTPLGKRVLRQRSEGWERLVTAVGRVLNAESRDAVPGTA